MKSLQTIHCHGGAMVVFHSLYSTAQPTRVCKAESLSVMGNARSAAVCSTGWDQKQPLL